MMTREMTTIATAPMTAQELERLSLPDKHVELVRGRLLVREPPGSWHGQISARLALRVGEYVQRHALGGVFAQDTGFKIAADPDTVRAPDLAFVARARMGRVARRGCATFWNESSLKGAASGTGRVPEPSAHGRFNALVRRLVSFERAAECAS